jgi:YVTN family beta-propeller protein
MAVDVSQPAAPSAIGAPITTAKAPEALLFAGGKLWLAAADGDQVAMVDPATASATSVASGLGDALYGTTPNAIAVDTALGRLYVANAGANSVEAFDVASLRSLGQVPTCWYPTAVAVRPDSALLVLCGRGLGAAATDHSPTPDEIAEGAIEVVAAPSADDLAAGALAVYANRARPSRYEPRPSCAAPGPERFALPVDPKQPRPIAHVFLIVRENKTYDAVLGDLPTGNGDPSLALFGGDVTPNLHALAARFANLDNFYSNAEQSLQGHEWTTAGMANDYTEKAWLTTWGRATRPVTAFSLSNELGHLAQPASPTLWQALDAAHIAYHNYGEIVNTSTALHILDNHFPGIFFDTSVPDVEKIAYVIGNLESPTFALEPFSYIALPNDHTVGTTPGRPTPASMVADNDEATGRFVDALSHSSYWDSSIVFIIEDDPQDGGDHVELHRSPCVVVSPWVRAGYTGSANDDLPSLLRTIGLLLGFGPLNQRDEDAAAMYDLFASTPDARPYTFIPRRVPTALNPSDAPLAEESARIDFSLPDQAPLGRILWKAMRGRDAEPPWGRPRRFIPDAD